MHIAQHHGGYFASFNAGALRSANVANTLAIAGHTVDLITGDREQTAIRGSIELFDLHPNIALHAGGPLVGNRLTNIIPRRINPLAQGVGRQKPPDLVLLSSPTPTTYRRAREYSSANGIPLLIDVDEWMGPADFSVKSWLTLFPLRYEIFMRRLPSITSKALTISDTFSKYMAKNGAQVLTVPPLHAPTGLTISARNNHKIRILLPGVVRNGKGKDRDSLRLVADAVVGAPHLHDRISFDVIGGVHGKEALGALSRLSKYVEVRNHGRVAWAQARQLLVDTDWLVALREPSTRRLRYAFPSKVTEALVAGTPVIANSYSDMKKVIFNGNTGILLGDLTVASVAAALQRAAESPLDRESVSLIARDCFTPAAFAATLDEFIRA